MLENKTGSFLSKNLIQQTLGHEIRQLSKT